MLPPPPRPPLFPYTTLFRSRFPVEPRGPLTTRKHRGKRDRHRRPMGRRRQGQDRRDRKSTRLNSSHLGISYAVFCLKKKKKIESNGDGWGVRERSAGEYSDR